jgi:signal transduction histidine kinase
LRSYDLSASEQGEVLDDLVETSRKIVALSQEVCKVMALESGHMNLNYETTSVENIIQLVARRNESAAKIKSMGIMLEIPSDLPEVYLDVHKIEDVVDNLVNNAIKYSHNGGKIRIRAYKQDKEMVVEVSDNGLGLSEEDIKNAFQRGAKLSARPTAGELSSGLGLWLVKRIVEEHKGRVWVRSSLGRGSTFAFQLPIEPPR